MPVTVSVVAPIKIDGVRELQAALKDADGEAQKQLRVVFNDVAETIAAGTRRRVPTGGPKVGKRRKYKRAKETVRASSGQREAIVKAGGAKAPYYPWLDFGGNIVQHKRKRIIKRPFVQEGRYLYPTFGANRDNIHRALITGLDNLARQVGWEVTRSG